MTRGFLKRLLAITLCVGLITSQNQFAFAGGEDSTSDSPQSSEESSSEGEESSNNSSNDSSNQNDTSQDNSDNSSTGDNSGNANPGGSNNDDGNSNNIDPSVAGDNSDDPATPGNNSSGNIGPASSSNNDNIDVPENTDRNNTDMNNTDANPSNNENTPSNPGVENQSNDNPNAPENNIPDNNDPAASNNNDDTVIPTNNDPKNTDPAVSNNDNTNNSGDSNQYNDNTDLLENLIQNPDDMQKSDIGQNLDPDTPVSGLAVAPDNNDIIPDPNTAEGAPLSTEPLGLQAPANVGKNDLVQPLDLSNSSTSSFEPLNLTTDLIEPQEISDLTLMSDLTAAPKTDAADLLTSTSSTSTNFEFDENGVVTGFDHTYDGKIIIPNGVIEIGIEAFNYFGQSYKHKDDLIKSVYIPSTVAIIGTGAFGGTDIISLDIPDSVVNDMFTSFNHCQKLEKVTVGSGVKELWSTFPVCTSLKDVSLPEGLEKIKDGAFEKCTNLKSIKLPSTLKYLDGFGESGITELAVPSGVEELGSCAFYGCRSLKKITIPVSVKTLGPQTFYNCVSLEDIYYEGTEEQWNELISCYHGGVVDDFPIPEVLHNCPAKVHFGTKIDDVSDVSKDDNSTKTGDYTPVTGQGINLSSTEAWVKPNTAMQITANKLEKFQVRG